MTGIEDQPRARSREAMIEDALIARPEALVFPGALAIRRCRVAQPCGSIDMMLFPAGGPRGLVLVEAKASSAPDAAAKVIGQLLMYYAGAMMLGSDGLESLRAFARDHPDAARSLTRITPKSVTGLSVRDGCWEAMYRGETLRPEQVALFVALDGEPHPAFRPTLETLKVHHDLTIGYCIVRDGQVELRMV